MVDTRARLTNDTRVWAIQPEMVAGLSTLEVSARRPDGGTDVLLALTDPSAEWPTPYLLKTPRLLARGTQVFVSREPQADNHARCACASAGISARSLFAIAPSV